jgi:hypothetical protein
MLDVDNKTVGTSNCYGSDCIQTMCDLWKIPNAYLLLAIQTTEFSSEQLSNLNENNCLGTVHMEMENIYHKIVGAGNCCGLDCIQTMCDLWKRPNAYLLFAVQYNDKETSLC